MSRSESSWPVQGSGVPSPSMGRVVGEQVAVSRVDHVIAARAGGSASTGPSITTTGGGSGGYFQLSPDEIRHYEQRFHAILQRAKDLRARIERAHGVRYEPAHDNPSVAQAHAVEDSMAAVGRHLGGIISYGTEYHNKLARSIHDYEHVDRVNSEDVNNAAHGDDSGRVV